MSVGDQAYEEQVKKQMLAGPSVIHLSTHGYFIPEPKGGAHRDWTQSASFLQTALLETMEPLLKTWAKNPDKLVKERIEKFRGMGLKFMAHAPITPGN